MLNESIIFYEVGNWPKTDQDVCILTHKQTVSVLSLNLKLSGLFSAFPDAKNVLRFKVRWFIGSCESC